jgi:DNA-directed RNA polymerase subunit RPC12/RpoP
MEFKFICSKCGQHILADEAIRGSDVPCPTCHANLAIPLKTTLTLSCAQCGQEVLIDDPNTETEYSCAGCGAGLVIPSPEK